MDAETINKKEDLEDRAVDRDPQFYRSMSDNPVQTRLKDTDMKKNVVRIVEYIEQAVDTSNSAVSTFYTFKVPFKKKYPGRPLVQGVVQFPDGNYLPYTHTSILNQDLNGNLLSTDLTTSTSSIDVTLTYLLGASSVAATRKQLKVKLRIYNLYDNNFHV